MRGISSFEKTIDAFSKCRFSLIVQCAIGYPAPFHCMKRSDFTAPPLHSPLNTHFQTECTQRLSASNSYSHVMQGFLNDKDQNRQYCGYASFDLMTTLLWWLLFVRAWSLLVVRSIDVAVARSRLAYRWCAFRLLRRE